MGRQYLDFSTNIVEWYKLPQNRLALLGLKVGVAGLILEVAGILAYAVWGNIGKLIVIVGILLIFAGLTISAAQVFTNSK